VPSSEVEVLAGEGMAVGGMYLGMAHSLEVTVPTASSSGLFLRFPTTLPTLDSLYLQDNLRSKHRSQPVLFPLHRT